MSLRTRRGDSTVTLGPVIRSEGDVIGTGSLTGPITGEVTITPIDLNTISIRLSDMHTLVIRNDGSSASVTSLTELRWTVPADLAAIAMRDSGSRYGATGRLTRTASGKPRTYAVAKDDLLEHVAQRFGLTSDELLWMNPFRSRRNSGLLYVGEELNLDPYTRG